MYSPYLKCSLIPHQAPLRQLQRAATAKPNQSPNHGVPCACSISVAGRKSKGSEFRAKHGCPCNQDEHMFAGTSYGDRKSLQPPYRGPPQMSSRCILRSSQIIVIAAGILTHIGRQLEVALIRWLLQLPSDNLPRGSTAFQDWVQDLSH